MHTSPRSQRDAYRLDKGTVEWLWRDVGIGDVVYDIDCGDGAYAMLAAKYHGAVVVAFEPGYAAFKALCDNLHRQRLRRIRHARLTGACRLRGDGRAEVSGRAGWLEGHSVKPAAWRVKRASGGEGSVRHPAYVRRSIRPWPATACRRRITFGSATCTTVERVIDWRGGILLKSDGLKTIVFTLPADAGEILAGRLAALKWYVTRHTPDDARPSPCGAVENTRHASGGRDVVSVVMSPRARTVLIGACSVGIFVASWLFRFNDPGGSFAGLTDDHFFYLVRGWQILFGDLPVRDFVDHGAPLYYYVGAAVQTVFGRGTAVGARVLDDRPVAGGGADVLADDHRLRFDLGGSGRLPAPRLARAPLLQLPEGPGLCGRDSAALVVRGSARHAAADVDRGDRR